MKLRRAFRGLYDLYLGPAINYPRESSSRLFRGGQQETQPVERGIVWSLPRWNASGEQLGGREGVVQSVIDWKCKPERVEGGEGAVQGRGGEYRNEPTDGRWSVGPRGRSLPIEETTSCSRGY